MKLGLINSAWVQTGRPTTYGLRKTKEIGFDTVDIFADPLEIDVRQRRLIKDECDRLGLSIVSICSVAVGLIDFEPYLCEVADLGIEGALSIELGTRRSRA